MATTPLNALSMQITPIDQPHALHCPSCATVIAQVSRSGLEPVGCDVLFTDGDAVPGAGDDVEARDPNRGFESMLSVGRCPVCHAGYYAVEAFFVDGPQDDLYAWMAADPDTDDVRRFLVHGSAADTTWIHGQNTTRKGQRIHEHLFGPFPADIAALIGPSGVSACGVRAQAAPWQHARDVVASCWHEMHAAHAYES